MRTPHGEMHPRYLPKKEETEEIDEVAVICLELNESHQADDLTDAVARVLREKDTA